MGEYSLSVSVLFVLRFLFSRCLMCGRFLLYRMLCGLFFFLVVGWHVMIHFFFGRLNGFQFSS